MFSWVFPCICWAFLPIAITFPVVRSIATIEGSSTTTLSLFIIKVFAVPKSIATSCVNKLNNPIIVNLVFKMSNSGKYHSNFIFITIFYR